jgi:type IV secretory pathway TrbL component
MRGLMHELGIRRSGCAPREWKGYQRGCEGAGGRCDHTRRFDIALAAIVLLGATLVGAEQPAHAQACTTNATNGGIVQSGGSCAMVGNEVR